jgi:hypothetical protein
MSPLSPRSGQPKDEGSPVPRLRARCSGATLGTNGS